MTSPDRLSTYIRAFGRCTVALPICQSFPAMAILGLRENSNGNPQGDATDFLRIVATAREIFPTSSAAWPAQPIQADGIRYDGQRIIVRKGLEEYRISIDRMRPIKLYSSRVIPSEFAQLADPELLELYLTQHEHTDVPLADEVRVPQMAVYDERPAANLPRAEKPLYDRPSSFKSLLWIAAGVVAVAFGMTLVTSGMKGAATGAVQGFATNIWGWFFIVAGVALIGRRILDLLFPPSRL
jgi:hypothetical protein